MRIRRDDDQDDGADHDPDSERIVQLEDFGDRFTAELVAAKLRAYGIAAQSQSGTIREIPNPVGNIVWVLERDLEVARELIAESDTPVDG